MIINSSLPDDSKVDITVDDIRPKSNSTANKTIKFTEKSKKNLIFYIILGFTRSLSGPLGKNDGFFHLFRGSYKSDKPVNFTGIDKIHLKCGFVIGSFVNVIREPVLYSFGSDKAPSHKTYNEKKSNFQKEKKICSVSHYIFFGRWWPQTSYF